MNQYLRQISQRMSLRKPQTLSMEALAWIADHIPMKKQDNTHESLKLVQKKFRTVTDFERNFPNICFALATGVGKTRLMGAIIAYLASVKGIRNFFVIAPNNTIAEKLIREFSNPTDPKYVFQGIAEFATETPQIITEANFEQGIGVRNRYAKQVDYLRGNEVHINIFNIAMIHSDNRRMKDPRETIVNCMSYFEYLAQLEDLVILMDEAHRYRANAASKAINELKPILGIELTATPQLELGTRSVHFKNIIYQYPLSDALKDGFVKEPWVGGRANFKASEYDEQALEKLKIEDGVRIHEQTKIFLQNYAYEANKKPIKPFMLLIAQNTAHANELETMLKSDDFFEGRYKNKVRVVHSAVKADEEERMVKDLLEVESFDNPTEIVIHVNMLKEGWDVVNLYTIVPLRAANSKTLIEQSLGRGLRLPYGRRTGITEIDRLTIVSHDRFDEIINEAKRPDSIIKSGFIIGIDTPPDGLKSIDIKPIIVQEVTRLNEVERRVAEKTLEQIGIIGSGRKEELLAKVTAELGETDNDKKEEIKRIVERTTERHEELSIKIPRIHVELEEVKPGYFHSFSLSLENVFPQPIAHPILMQSLENGARENLTTENPFELLDSPEHTLANALLDFDGILDAEENWPTVLNLAEQIVTHLRSYLKNEEDVQNVLLNHKASLVNLIHAQMQAHFDPPEHRFSEEIARDFTFLKNARYVVPAGQEPQPFDLPIEQKSSIKNLLFTGFRRSIYPITKFDSDAERIFACILEQDTSVTKWVKPPRGVFQIFYHKDFGYEPDFVVETNQSFLLCEVKRSSDLQDPLVIQKAQAATHWCSLASKHAKLHHTKPWQYLLIPHDCVDLSASLEGLIARFIWKP